MKVICTKSFIDRDRDIIAFEKGVIYDVREDGWVKSLCDDVSMFIPKTGDLWIGSYEYFRLLGEENLDKLGI